MLAAGLAAYLVAALFVDRYADRRGQLAIGLATLVVLLLAARVFPPRVRLQAGLVVVVATMAEVLGSIVWGVYQYRLGNLPPFVPPGHGIVYLLGLSFSLAVRSRERLLVNGAIALVVLWGLAGVTVLPRTDVSGLIGCTVLAAVLVWSRHPVYAGVALAVAALELYGTAVGTWTWAEIVPGLGLSQGNPPSGVASGYVLFDVFALVTAPFLLRLLPRLPGRAQPEPA